MLFKSGNNSLRRRDFLAYSGSIIGCSFLSTKSFALSDARPIKYPILHDLEKSIHAHFGSGFQLCSAEVASGKTVCLIENRGNFLRVTSPSRQDDPQWLIEEATEM